MTNTTTHEESVLDSNTEVAPASDEQQDSQVETILEDNTPKGFNKFAMKTNEKTNKLGQSLKDERKLNSFLLRGKTAQDIKDEEPEFANRLAKMDEYHDLFSDPEDEANRAIENVVSKKVSEVESEREIKEAISDLVVDGKRLSLGDRKLLKSNSKFNRILKGFIGAGFDAEESAQRAFKETYPSKANMVETSFLSASSEVTVKKKETPSEGISKKFNNPNTFPPFLRKRMKK